MRIPLQVWTRIASLLVLKVVRIHHQWVLPAQPTIPIYNFQFLNTSYNATSLSSTLYRHVIVTPPFTTEDWEHLSCYWVHCIQAICKRCKLDASNSLSHSFTYRKHLQCTIDHEGHECCTSVGNTSVCVNCTKAPSWWIGWSVGWLDICPTGSLCSPYKYKWGLCMYNRQHSPFVCT